MTIKAQTDSEQTVIQVAETQHVHLVVDGRALCGKTFDDKDVHAAGAGLRVWQERAQCGVCASALRGRRR